jgi:hypothetical protein
MPSARFAAGVTAATAPSVFITSPCLDAPWLDWSDLRHGSKGGYSCGTLASMPAGFIVAFRSAKAHPFAERKTAIWELAKRTLFKLGTYLPPSRHEIVTFCLLRGWQPLSAKGHLCHVRGSRLAILVHQGSDPT